MKAKKGFISFLLFLEVKIISLFLTYPKNSGIEMKVKWSNILSAGLSNLNTHFSGHGLKVCGNNFTY